MVGLWERPRMLDDTCLLLLVVVTVKRVVPICPSP